MLEKIVVVTCVACIVALTMACSTDSEDACEHASDLCSKDGAPKSDCSKANADYDKLSDADKAKSDKLKDCLLDADTCEGVGKCIAASAK